MNKELTLYYFDTCPFCIRVLRYLEGRGISIPMKNTMQDASAREELMQIGGKTQVPCLVIDGQPLYESADIVSWFEENWT
jgi:glutaredoxin